MILNGSTNILQAVMAAAHTTTAPSFWASWTRLAATDLETGDSVGGVLNGTTDVALITGVASKQLAVDTVDVYNADTVAHTITFKMDVSATDRLLYKCILQPGESAHYAKGQWYSTDVTGQIKTTTSATNGVGWVFEFLGIGTASEAVGVRYGFAKDAGLPGAWVPGTPGVNGWWTDASANTNAANPAGATQTGSPQLQNASVAWYLSRIGLATSVAHAMQLLDVLWYNTGLVVTTTGAQAIAQPGASIPARDTYGTTNGHGWMAGIYVTTATTNAGVTAPTLSYTNSEGTAGRTATMSFPATAVVGTFVPFRLQAGDKGIRSIQSISLVTSLVTGAISLVMYRQLAFIPNTVVNVGAGSDSIKRNTRIFNGTAFWWTYISSATTATNFQAGIELEDR